MVTPNVRASFSLGLAKIYQHDATDKVFLRSGEAEVISG
jgi:hypothetical protein